MCVCVCVCVCVCGVCVCVCVRGVVCEACVDPRHPQPPSACIKDESIACFARCCASLSVRELGFLQLFGGMGEIQT